MFKDLVKSKVSGNKLFSTGDYIEVLYKEQMEDSRVFSYTGCVISLCKKGVATNFTVRKISHNIGVERTFMCNSPLLIKVNVKIKNKLRKSKIYYIRKKTLKSV